MKLSGILTLFIVLLVAVYIADDWKSKDAKVIAAARDTVRITDSIRSIVAETVKVKLAAKLRTDTLVQVMTDTQVVIRREPTAKPETVTVLAEIGERIRTCDAFASSCRLQLAADSSEINALKRLVALQKPPRKLSLGVTAGYGCVKTCGFGLAVGLTYRFGR